MNIYTENHSSFPKVNENLILKKALDRFDKKELSSEELDKVIEKTEQSVIKEQLVLGLDIINDGMIKWQDEISYIMFKFEGVKRGDLLRWFDTNFYYRVPIIERPLFLSNYLLRNDINFSKGIDKIVITGPYTLAKMSTNKVYKNFEDLVYVLAMFIGKEVKYLASDGFFVQINEPAITKHIEDKRLFLSIMKMLFEFSEDFNNKTILSTYFGDVRFMLKELIDLDCGGLIFDLVEGVEQFQDLLKMNFINKDLHLGLLDARTTKLESYEYYLKFLSLLDPIKFKNVYVGPNNGLEFLPWDSAVNKLENMVECVNKYKEIR